MLPIIGAKYQEEHIGNCRYSDIAIFALSSKDNYLSRAELHYQTIKF